MILSVVQHFVWRREGKDDDRLASQEIHACPIRLVELELQQLNGSKN